MTSATLFVILWTGISAAVGQSEPRVASLRGIKQVHLALDPLPPEIASASLTRATLMADVAGRLGAGALTVGSNGEDAAIHMILNAVLIETAAGRNAGVAYNVSLAVEQSATLRNGENVAATTWRAGGIGVTARGRAGEAIRRQLREYVDRLLTDWRSANERNR